MIKKSCENCKYNEYTMQELPCKDCGFESNWINKTVKITIKRGQK